MKKKEIVLLVIAVLLLIFAVFSLCYVQPKEWTVTENTVELCDSVNNQLTDTIR